MSRVLKLQKKSEYAFINIKEICKRLFSIPIYLLFQRKSSWHVENSNETTIFSFLYSISKESTKTFILVHTVLEGVKKFHMKITRNH